jgi:hypothetical protein
MKEKSSLSMFDDLLAEYGLTNFHLDLVMYFTDETCDRAKRDWKSDWEFCPTCGGEIDRNMDVWHKSSKTSFS